MKEIILGDCLDSLKKLPNGSVNCIVTSPPYYGLRDYGMKEQIGLEETPKDYIDKLVAVFRECKRVLTHDGTLWVNIGDSYNGSGRGRGADGKVHSSSLSGKQGTNKGSVCGTFQKEVVDFCKPKDMIGIPWMLAFALRDDGWYLRQDIIWHKPNPMPEPVKDRCVKSHEYIFLLSKSPRYYFDYEAIQEEANYDGRKDTLLKGSPKYETEEMCKDKGRPHQRWQVKTACIDENVTPQYKNLQDKGQPNHSMHKRRAEGLPDEAYMVRNKRDVWSIPTRPNKEAHFATFPEDLIEPCILAGCPKGGTVLDPFCGSRTTGIVSVRHERNFIGLELNPEYAAMSERRIAREESYGIQESWIGML